MKYDKKKAVSIITSAASIYDDNLNNRDVLFIAKRQKALSWYEMRFISANFKHFTGVDSSLSANKFFSNALDKRLSLNDIIFKDDYLAGKKMNILEDAVRLPYTAKMIGEFNYAGIKIQAEVGSGSVGYTMAFRKDGNGLYYPVSVIEEDIRKSVMPASPIAIILRKDIVEDKYNEITYRSKNINIEHLHFPNELLEIISDDVVL